MKIRIVIYTLFILFPSVSFMQSAEGQTQLGEDSIIFRNVSFEEGLKLAQAEKKPMFFMGYASWCEHCHKMLDKIFKDSSVANYFNSHFVCLKQDMEKGEGIELKETLHVKSYPTFVFLDGKGTTLYQCTGEHTDSAMIKEGMNALTPDKQFPYLKQQFEADVTNSEKCFAYVFALRAAMLDCEEPAMKHLATQTDQQLLSPLNWKIIANGIRDINSREFQFVLSHQKEFAAVASPARVERKIVNIADELLTPLVNADDSTGYLNKRPLASSMHNHAVDSLIFKLDLLLDEKTGNWEAYKKVTLQSVETFAWNNISLLKDILGNYLRNITDTAALITAAKWGKHALQLNEDYSTYILCAKLWQKAGDKKEAIQNAQQAKDYAAKYGWDHKEADALITDLQK